MLEADVDDADDVGVRDVDVDVDVDVDEPCPLAPDAELCARGWDMSLPVMNGWSSACAGVMRARGSQRRHSVMKLRKRSSLQRSTAARSLPPGTRDLPRELGTTRGFPFESKKFFFLLQDCTMRRGGTPISSMMHWICSASSSPGKMGQPVSSSQRMQPSDHMSMEAS